MTETQPRVVIVDDDDAMRESLEFLLTTVGNTVKGFGSGEAVLEYLTPDFAGCILLDVRMPGMDGLEVQRRLRERGVSAPIILLTAYGDVSTAVRAMREGAFDFVEKPCEEENLVQRIDAALAHAEERLEDRTVLESLKERYQRLSQRERDVMHRVVIGRLNKEIAQELGISVKTVEAHRSAVMSKMAAGSLAELVRMSIKLELGPVATDD